MQETSWVDVFEDQAKPYFEKHLLPLAGQPGLRFLQLGVALGDATIWLLDQVLYGEDSRLTDVDTWEGLLYIAGAPPMPEVDFKQVYLDYKQRVARRNNLGIFRRRTDEFLLDTHRSFYDFIYVDAAHDSWHVLSDAVLSYHHLKPGGLLAFDDYTWPTVNRAVNAFLGSCPDDVDVIDERGQLWLRRISQS